MPSHGRSSRQWSRPDHVSRRQANVARAELAAGGLSQQDRRRLRPAIDAASGGGTAGTFVLSTSVCTPKLGCRWVGNFESAGSQPTQVDYQSALPAGAGPGTSVPAVHPGGSSYVFAPHGSHAWIPDLLLVLVIGAVVALVLWISPISLSRRGKSSARTA
jgi:hypothetical protein